ncbi:MFS transporter [Roseivivax isoporae]|uniref:Major facilitator transporter n=1 Tax=Roseivivax isoporae LMG 25204 TaxID=1449351 RepID=X7FAH5_9RHOB|nr:MFS transporter [Roseivivax isoporae]ETX29091.1 major facilitator transporter [Roseivivax isoporae LMG 25204]
MIKVLAGSWALFLGMMLLMLGNGLQSSLLGVRGSAAGFSALQMSLVMAAYFVGFMIASQVAPGMIRRVGHVRVFAALGSFISAVLILYPTIETPWAWIVGRVIIGFCFCGVYVTAESWLNNSVTNETRGQALSLYMIVQMVGIISAQALLNVPDPTGFLLFVIPSVLVSIAFAPILLSVTPTPAFESTRPMSLFALYRTSPLGCVGMLLMGAVYGAQFGMSAVYASQAGLSLGETSIFVAAIYVGALVFQYPLGWLSDRMDRRVLIAGAAAVGGAAGVVGLLAPGSFGLIVCAAVVMGGCANPLYSLLIAYTNDYLPPEEMASASAGMLLLNGLGAIAGPVLTGWLMDRFGASAFFLLIAVPMLLLTVYALYRMTRRPAPSSDVTGAYAPVAPVASVVAFEVAQEFAVESAQDAAGQTDPT